MRGIAPDPDLQLWVNHNGFRPVRPARFAEPILDCTLQSLASLALTARALAVQNDQTVTEPFAKWAKEFVPVVETTGVSCGVDEYFGVETSDGKRIMTA